MIKMKFWGFAHDRGAERCFRTRPVCRKTTIIMVGSRTCEECPFFGSIKYSVGVKTINGVVYCKAHTMSNGVIKMVD